MFIEDRLVELIDLHCEILNFCHEKGIFRSFFNCPNCRKKMKLIKFKYQDEYIWRCYGKNCANKMISVRKDSLFSNIRCYMLTILRVLYK